MRKRLLAFLMVLCLCQMPQMVWAAEVTEKMPQGTEAEKLTEAETVPESEKQTETEKNQSESDQTESEQAAAKFQIDDTHIYEGMEKAYKDGYEPTVADDKVQMVLPLVTEDMKAVSSVTVTPNLGDTGTAPFVYQNYQKTFKATEEKVNGTKDKKQVFLVSYTFPLKSASVQMWAFLTHQNCSPHHCSRTHRMHCLLSQCPFSFHRQWSHKE